MSTCTQRSPAAARSMRGVLVTALASLGVAVLVCLGLRWRPMNGRIKGLYAKMTGMGRNSVQRGEFKRVIEPANPHGLPRLPVDVERSVLVCGGGLAGLSAALELAERGYKVTIREKDDVLGGRLKTRRVSLFQGHENTTFDIEHGFHAWFNGYYTFQDIRRRLGIDKHFRTWGGVQFVFKKNYKPELIESTGPYPLNLFNIILRSPNLSIMDAIKSLRAVPDMLGFNYDTVWKDYDHISFKDWAEMKGVGEKFYDIVMAPSLSVTVNERSDISAAEMLSYMHLYFLNNPKADNREVATCSYGRSVIGPWRQRLEQLGTDVQLGRAVDALHFHRDGTVSVEDEHGHSTYDYAVLATSLPAVKSILSASTFGDSDVSSAMGSLRKNIDALEVAPPYKVLRGFFDKKLEEEFKDQIVLETPDAAPVNLIAQYHLIEDEPMAWANATGGSVLEFHMYTWTMGDIPDEEVWEAIRPTVCEYILPEMCERNFKLLAYYVQSNQDFPSYRKGLDKFRPKVDGAYQLGAKNLVFAGDWVRTPYPSELMERAVSTGREAANLVLLQDSVRQAPMVVTSNYGPGYRVMQPTTD